MSPRKLEKLVRDFRRGILDGEHPESWCFMVSAPLESYLQLCGVPCWLVEGEMQHLPNCVHYWIELPSGEIIDATASQFKKPDGKRMPQVFIGEKPDWYIPKTDEVARKLWETTMSAAYDEKATEIHLEPTLPVKGKCDLIVSLRENRRLEYLARIPAELASSYLRQAAEGSGIRQSAATEYQTGHKSWTSPVTDETIQLKISASPAGDSSPFQRMVIKIVRKSATLPS